MKKHSLNHQAGFTIVELMIATAVFSLVLLLCSVAIVHVGRMYYKGVITNRTQDTSRKVIEEVSQAIQFGAKTGEDEAFRRTGSLDLGGGITAQSLCLGEVRYSYVLDRSLGTGTGQIKHVLWRDRVEPLGGCTPRTLTADVPSAGGEEMLGEKMRLPAFTVCDSSVTGCPVSGDLWHIAFTVSYGDSADLFVTGTNFTECIGTNVGGQFCAVSSINTKVVKRL